MDWSAIWKWALAPSGLLAAFAAWLLRRRKAASNGGGPVRWLGRRYDAEAGLVACEERERRKDRDFASERIRWAALETAMRSQQDALMEAMQQLIQANELVLNRRDAGKLPVSSPGPAASPPSSSRGPTTPSGER